MNTTNINRIPSLEEQEEILRFLECRTKAQYRAWMEQSLEGIGYRFVGASWGLDRDFRKLKLAEIVELAEALRYGQFKYDFIPLLNAKGLFVLRGAE